MRSADRQLELLERLQALLRESKYTTTYTFDQVELTGPQLMTVGQWQPSCVTG